MRPPEGPRLDAAVDLFHNHAWRGLKPTLSVEQVAELLPVWESWYRTAFAPTPQADRPKQKIPSRPKRQGAVSSSDVPKRIRDAVLARDDWSCQRCGVSLYGRFYSLQHRDNRGMGGSKRKHTMANLVALCGTGTTECHGHVESEPLESDRLGWSVPNGAVPEEWPVLRFGSSWEQPGTGWEKASPHERQIELGALEVA